MLQKGCHTLILQLAYHAGTHIHHLLVFVKHALVHYALAYLLLYVLVEEGKEQLFRLFIGEYLQLVGVFYVHDFIADVVCRLHQIHQRMAGIPQWFAGSRKATDTQLRGYLPVRFRLSGKEAELAVVASTTAGKGILHDGGQHGIGHHETAGTPSLEAMGKYAEGIGVALEMGKVVPQGGRHLRLQCLAGTLGEEGLYGFLARMAEGRVAQIVCQAGGTHDGAYLLKERVFQFGTFLHDDFRHVIAQRHAHARHLQTVRESVVHEDAARQGKHLRLVLQPAEGRREDETVVVAFELGAVIVPLGMFVFLAEALV